MMSVSNDLLSAVGDRRFGTVLADPPWQFQNRTGKVAPEHRRLARYSTMSFESIAKVPVADIVTACAHLYLWVPNALLPYGLDTMERWGFTYKTNLIWYKVRKDGGPDRRGVGFYFPQCHGDHPVWNSRPQLPDTGTGTEPGEHDRLAKARAQQEAR